MFQKITNNVMFLTCSTWAGSVCDKVTEAATAFGTTERIKYRLSPQIMITSYLCYLTTACGQITQI